jgi:ABC-type nitrate/sulfonate/bicarbonate transport system substrate-binding protein
MRPLLAWLPLALVSLVMACTSGGAPAAPAAPAGPAPPPRGVGAGAAERPAGEPRPNATPLPHRRVKIAYPSNSLSQMDFMYAVDAGMYARHGVEVEGAILPTAAAIAALLNDDVQYVYAAASLLMTSAKGLPVRSFWQSFRGPTLDLYVQPDIMDYADLRGKTVATLTPGGLVREVTMLLMEKHGLNPREVQYIAGGTDAAQLELLRQGMVAGSTFSAPWPVMARREGFRRLARMGEEIPYPFGVFATTTARLAAEPAEAKAIIRGTLDTQRALREDRASVIAWIARHFEVDADMAAESYELTIPFLNDGGEIPREAVANYFRAQEDQPELRDTRYEDLVDTELIRAVWQEMGLR